MATDRGGAASGDDGLSRPSTKTPDPTHGCKVIRSPLTPDRQALALTAEDWLWQEVNRAPLWLKARLGRDEIEQEARYAALKAAADFDPEKYPGVRFAAFARLGVQNHLMGIRQQCSLKLGVWQVMPTEATEGWQPSSDLPDHRPTVHPLLHAWHDEDYVRQRRFLDWRSRILLYLRFVEGWTLEEVGEGLGITRERVRQVEDKAGRNLAAARNRMRRQLDTRGIT